MTYMTKEQLECIRQISETVGLLSRQLGNFADLFQSSTSDTDAESYELQEVAPNSTLPDTTDEEVVVEGPVLYSPMYFGAPSGNGFEDSSQLPSSSVKCLYVILRKSETQAQYHPLPEKLSRFKMNTTSLFTPVCTSVGEISEASSFKFTEDDFGELEYESGYWKVIKKCNVHCI